MAPLKSVKKLCDLCQKNVTKMILIALHKIRENTASKSSVEDFLSQNLVLSSSAEILETILQDSNIDSEIKCIAFLTLHRWNSKKLKFALGFQSEYHPKILDHLQNSSSELEVADFRGVWLQNSDLDRLHRDVLPQMSQLRHLALPHIADDKTLDVISNSCKKIISLDLYGSSGVTAVGLKTASKKLYSTLQLLNLGGPVDAPLDPEQVAECLSDLKELASLGSYPYGGAAVAFLAENSNSKSKLKYVHDRYTTQDTMKVLPEVCPNLQGLFLDSPEKGIFKFLPQFSRLTKLKVSKLDAEDFHSVLETLKPDADLRLTVLEVVNARGSLDLYQVSKAFPRLESFEMFYSTSTHVSIKENFAFPNLKKLIIYDTEIRGGSAEVILSSCPKIVTLTLAHCEELTDEAFLGILEKNPMEQCQELSLLFAPLLSSDTLRYAISCLPSIKYIGRLDNWNVTWTEVEEMSFEIRHYNLDVILGEQFNNIDKFQAIENQENAAMGFGAGDDGPFGEVDEDDVFYDVLLVPDDEIDDLFFM